MYAYSYGSFVAKPHNILHVPTSHDHDSMVALIMALPATLDLRTVNLSDYPEFFI